MTLHQGERENYHKQAYLSFIQYEANYYYVVWRLLCCYVYIYTYIHTHMALNYSLVQTN